MICEACRDLDLTSSIRSRGDLSRAIGIVRANLDDGTLDEVAEGRNPTTERFRDLPEAGPWPDIVSFRFRCTSCGAEYRLFADTYHGSGGSWSRAEAR